MKCQWFTPSGWKEVVIKKFEFVAKTQFLCLILETANFDIFSWLNNLLKHAINFLWGNVICLNKIGPNHLYCLKVYWTQTNRQAKCRIGNYLNKSGPSIATSVSCWTIIPPRISIFKGGGVKKLPLPQKLNLPLHIKRLWNI